MDVRASHLREQKGRFRGILLVDRAQVGGGEARDPPDPTLIPSVGVREGIEAYGGGTTVMAGSRVKNLLPCCP